jgi:hypothetical protein
VVARGVDAGIFAAEETADYAQLQLDALLNATSILQQIADNTAPVPQPAGSGVQTLPSNETTSPVIVEQNQKLLDQNGELLEVIRRMDRMWTRFEGDGLLIRTDADTPIQTEAV